MTRLLRVCILALLAEPLAASGDAVPDTWWPHIQESFFAGQPIQDGEPFIRLHAPERAEDASLTPFSFQVELPPGDALKRAYLFTDANPIPLTALFHFPDSTHQADMSTRIRLDKNSYVRVIAETTAGRLFMHRIAIKTPGGGCGGGVGGDEASLRQQAGRIKLKTEPGAIGFHIRHPMRTGFERTPMGYYAKAWFINRLDFSMNGHPILGIDIGPGISADPYFRIGYPGAEPGRIAVEAADNEGNRYTQNDHQGD